MFFLLPKNTCIFVGLSLLPYFGLHQTLWDTAGGAAGNTDLGLMEKQLELKINLSCSQTLKYTFTAKTKCLGHKSP